jgi:sugar phosphate isomerase/epimerase
MRSLGIVDVVYAPAPIDECARLAAADGFAHLDVTVGAEASDLALPIGDRCAFPSPRSGCSTPAPPDEPGMWERAVRAYHRVEAARIEPWGGSILNSVERCRAFLAEVPGLRLLVDTGHVAAWGEDPCDLLDAAGHVQLRQAAPGRVQVHADDPSGVVDFGRVFDRLDTLGYRGLVSVEYFDLPAMGWPLDDPRAWAVGLARRLRR